jgi:hypothetical protein
LAGVLVICQAPAFDGYVQVRCRWQNEYQKDMHLERLDCVLYNHFKLNNRHYYHVSRYDHRHLQFDNTEYIHASFKNHEEMAMVLI